MHRRHRGPVALRTLAPALGVAVAALSLAVPARESEACINTQRRAERATFLVAEAESFTNKGFHADALKRLAPVFAEDARRDELLIEHGKIVAARVIARTGGHYGLDGSLAEDEHAARANLLLAGGLVQARLLKQPDDPGLRGDYAEVLAQLPEKRGEARSILVDLARRDLMTTAFGYAALARVRATPRKGLPSWLGAPLQTLDRAPRFVDLARCERMAAVDGLCQRESNPDRRVNAPVPKSAAVSPGAAAVPRAELASLR
jgi:hypothetical protein